MKCKKCGVELTKKTANLSSFGSQMCKKCRSKYNSERREICFNKLPEE